LKRPLSKKEISKEGGDIIDVEQIPNYPTVHETKIKKHYNDHFDRNYIRAASAAIHAKKPG
ncbi:unnamed protein product, partial [Urochloa humidicola]